MAMHLITSNPKILGLALLGGIVPSLLWLWFWLHEEGQKPEPKGLLIILFILGMTATIFVLPIQKYIQVHVSSKVWQLIGWAAAEELMKFLAVMVILYKSNQIDEATDWPIYLITAAVGFAALENALFLLRPFALGEATVGLLTGQLRFLGSTLLHTVSSGMVGVSMGLSLYMGKVVKKIYLVIGLCVAIALHSSFNFFIMKNTGNGFLQVFAFLWVTAVIMMLLFEKLRRVDQ
ncbi:MAG: PrsW family glutamic-type intramembrane protease [Patescibacteria group bacterium]